MSEPSPHVNRWRAWPGDSKLVSTFAISAFTIFYASRTDAVKLFFEPLSPRWRRFLTAFTLLFLALALVLWRFLTFREPLERDLTTYAVIAHEMLGGRALYSDLWDIKPPGIYLFYAGAQLIAGYGQASIFLLGTAAALATLIGVFQLVRRLTFHALFGLWAAFFWVLIGSDLQLQANWPNVEAILNALGIWALVFFLGWIAPRVAEKENPPSFGFPWALLGAGVLWACATACKQVAFAAPLLACVAVLVLPTATAWRTRWNGAGALLLPTFLLWGALFAYFGATGRGAIFRFTLIEFPRQYAAFNTPQTDTATLQGKIWPPFLEFATPMLWLIVVAIALSWRRPRLWIALGLMAVATQIAIALPHQYFHHYYQLWLPWLCAASGLAFFQLKNRLQSLEQSLEIGVSRSAIGAGLGATWLCWLLWAHARPNLSLSPDEFSTQKYNAPVFVDLKSAAQQIDRLLKPNETLYQYGFDSIFHFETRSRPPVGVICLGAPDHPPLPEAFQTRIIAQLESQKPELAIIDTAFPASPVTRYLREHYVPIGGDFGQKAFVFLARRGGNLQKRLP